MTFIDLSDAEGMIGLFVELVADERTECLDDSERMRFVEELLAELRSVEANLDQIRLPAIIGRLKELQESASTSFTDDPVMAHLNDLIQELESSGASVA